MEQLIDNWVPLECTSWEHAHELATVLRRAGFDPEYDPPRPGVPEGAIGFAPSALYVPADQADEARELIAKWRSHSERRVEQLTREMWKQLLPFELLPIGLLLFAVALASLMALRSLPTGTVFTFLLLLFGGCWFACRQRTGRQS